MVLHGQSRGFSLLELSIVISIMGILSVLAFPYWEETLDTYRLRSAAGLLSSDLRLARFEAVKSNNQVRVRTIGNTGYIIEKNSGGGWNSLRPAVDFSAKYFTRGAAVSSGVDPALFYPSGRAQNIVTYSITLDGRAPIQINVSLSGMIYRET